MKITQALINHSYNFRVDFQTIHKCAFLGKCPYFCSTLCCFLFIGWDTLQTWIVALTKSKHYPAQTEWRRILLFLRPIKQERTATCFPADSTCQWYVAYNTQPGTNLTLRCDVMTDLFVFLHQMSVTSVTINQRKNIKTLNTTMRWRRNVASSNKKNKTSQ